MKVNFEEVCESEKNEAKSLSSRANYLFIYKDEWLRTSGLFTKEWIMFRKPFRIVILTLSWSESLVLPFVNTKLFQIMQALEMWKRGCFGSWSAYRKPDSDDMWMQCSFGTMFLNVKCANINYLAVQCTDPVCDRDGGCTACECM